MLFTHPVFRWLIVAGLLTLAWWTTAGEIWLRWFPHWSRIDLSLWQRLTESGSVGRYILLVPIASVLLAVLVYRRVGLPSRHSIGASVCGWGLLLVALAVHAVSLYAGVTFTSSLAWIMTLGALLLLAGGWPLARAYGAPVLLLLFAVPLPMVWIAQATLNLKFAASTAAIWLAQAMGGPVVHRYGSYLVLPGLTGATSGGGASGASGVSGGVMVVADACSGLRSLGALMWCGVLFALVCQLRGMWRWSVLLLAVPLAIACNVLRITATLLLAPYAGIAAVTEGGTLHHWLGLAAFIAAMAALLVYERLVRHLGYHLGQNWTDPRWLGWAGGQENRNAGKQEIREIRGARVPMTAVVLLAAIAMASLNTSTQAQPTSTSVSLNWSPIPRTLRIAGQTYRGTDLPIDDRIIEVLHTHNILYRCYRPVSGDSPPARGDTPRLPSGGGVELLVVYSPTDRQSIHPPEVCLRGGGWQLVEKPMLQLHVAGQDGTVAMRQLAGATPDRATCHLYAYHIGDHYTTSYVSQQASALWAKMAHEPASVALVRISALARGQGDGNETAAAKLAAAAARALMRGVDRVLGNRR